jgi:hypothetical protein
MQTRAARGVTEQELIEDAAKFLLDWGIDAGLEDSLAIQPRTVAGGAPMMAVSGTSSEVLLSIWLPERVALDPPADQGRTQRHMSCVDERGGRSCPLTPTA